MLNRNIKLAYLLAFLKNSWFWLGIWVLYYLRYTNYAGIGLIETVLIVTMTVSEIPTGAIADLLGRKKTLCLSFLFQAICNLAMAMAPNFTVLISSVFIGAIGLTLYSGTMEAFLYDTLLEEKQVNKYDKVIANITTLQLITPALFGTIGGFMYSLKPSLPFFASGMAYLTGFIITFFLKEPSIDSEKFSWSVFLNQTKQGISQLTRTLKLKQQLFLMLSVAGIIVIADEMINSFLGVEFGFSGKQLGILWSVIYIVSAFASQITPKITKIFSGNKAFFFIGSLMVASFLVSPVVTLFLGGLSLIFRSSLQAIYGNLTSITINQTTESKYRATTLSTFNMIKNIPYVLTAYFIGFLADIYSARMIALGLGLLLGALILFQLSSHTRDIRLNFSDRMKKL